MKIVVLAGGTSTERDVSIVSGTGICGALRQKGHQAILVDVFCGQEEVDWEDPFPAEYDVEKAAAYIRGFNLQMAELKKTRKNFFGPNVIDLCKKADFVFLGLHGANGEDGKLQGAFDLTDIFCIPTCEKINRKSTLCIEKNTTFYYHKRRNRIEYQR